MEKRGRLGEIPRKEKLRSEFQSYRQKIKKRADEIQMVERADEIKIQIAKIEAAKEQARIEAAKEQIRIEADKELALKELELKVQQRSSQQPPHPVYLDSLYYKGHRKAMCDNW